jgi:nucleoside-diphosphate-sugar epimerase
MKKVVITGGSGFIGQHVAALLLKKGYEVSVFDLRPPPKIGEFVKADLMDKNLPSGLLGDADTIIHYNVLLK